MTIEAGPDAVQGASLSEPPLPSPAVPVDEDQGSNAEPDGSAPPAGCSSRQPGAGSDPPDDVGSRGSRWLFLGLVVVGALAAAAVAVLTSGTSDTLTVPPKAPSTLLSVSLDRGAFERNSEWSARASQISEASTASFAAVYGTYPVRHVPTTGTFFVVASAVRGGNQNIPGLMRQEVNKAKESLASPSGSRLSIGARQSSIAGGQIQCLGAGSSPTLAGECIWLNPDSLVQLETFTVDLPTVQAMTTQVVEELQDGQLSGARPGSRSAVGRRPIASN